MNEKKKPKVRPKYTMWQNSWFMVKLAWTSKEKKVLVLGMLYAFAMLGQNLVELYIAPMILDAVEKHVSLGSLLIVIGAFTFAGMFFAAAASYIDENILYGRISVRLEIINLLNQKASTTSYANIEKESFRQYLEQASNYTSSNQQATEAIWRTLTNLLSAGLGFLIYLLLLSTVQPVLFLNVLVTAVISYLVGNYLNGYRYRHRDEQRKYYNDMVYAQKRAEDFTAAKDIRIFGMRPWIEELYQKASFVLKTFHARAETRTAWAGVCDLLLTFLRNAVAYAYFVGMVLHGEISVPEFLLYFAAVGGFAEWIKKLMNGLMVLHKQSLDICVVRECLDYEEPFRFKDGEHLMVEEGKSYELQLKNVSFRYPEAEKDTLSNISLTLHPGEKLAVVGLNGAGKTTLIKLLCGFLDPTEGTVLLNGRDIREYNRAEYYALFSAVFQEFSLLAGSVALNVAQTEEEMDMQRVKECIRQAGLTEKIESLPKQYDTLLNRQIYEDAILLSGGETQRLMLARALYKNAPFVILDEPTAALDPIAEAEMYQKYNEMTKGKSSVYISHRLASTRFCDRVLMIADAGICEEGTHEELMQLHGAYAELYEVQSKYYKEGEKADGEL